MDLGISFFARRPFVGNLILISCLGFGALAWQRIGKEELPEFTMDWMRIGIAYPQAAAQDVEALVTRPVELELAAVSGLREVSSTSSYGMSTFRIEFAPGNDDPRQLVADIKDAVGRATLPEEAQTPIFWQFTSRDKPILEIALYHPERANLDLQSRRDLQAIAYGFEQRLRSLPSVSGFDRNGYLKPEIQIRLNPAALASRNLDITEIRSQILAAHNLMPLGRMLDSQQSDLTLAGEIKQVDDLRQLILRSNFSGHIIRLGDVAEIEWGFPQPTYRLNAQGHEAIWYTIRKSSAVDILKAQQEIMTFLEDFKRSSSPSTVAVITADDGSVDVRNRIAIIVSNGFLGFLLIIFVLFFFLDVRTGLWVAVGIPFSLALTLIVATALGLTVNNMTLAAVIIVLGIVVDDAIIVADNVRRLQARGQMTPVAAAIAGTRQVVLPLFASILTTCAAFVPLASFSGRFGLLVRLIPVIITVMLVSSLSESMWILPAHLARSSPKRRPTTRLATWGRNIQLAYVAALQKILPWRWPLVALSAALLTLPSTIFLQKLRYVMFPREESREISVQVKGAKGDDLATMATRVHPLEKLVLADAQWVRSVKTRIGQNSRGGDGGENQANLLIEITPRQERDLSVREVIRRWEQATAKLEGLGAIRFLTSRWGSSSGSAIEIEVLENDDTRRQALALQLSTALQSNPNIASAEVDQPPQRPEQRLELRRTELARLGISAPQLGRTLRTWISGQTLYHLTHGDEAVAVRLVGPEQTRTHLDHILRVPVAGRNGSLVATRHLVDTVLQQSPLQLQRRNGQRLLRVFADLTPDAAATPLEIATHLEQQIFPSMVQQSPSTRFAFRGEIESSRESQNDFAFAIAAALALIYVLLAALFQSLALPLIIASVIPFGLAGVVVTFYLHDMLRYGFFAVIGSIGLVGVLINDAIIMVAAMSETCAESIETIATEAGKRLSPVIASTLTTAIGLLPTAYGVAGYDSMLAEMMLALGWGLMFGTGVTLLLVPCLYRIYHDVAGLMPGRNKSVA